MVILLCQPVDLGLRYGQFFVLEIVTHGDRRGRGGDGGQNGNDKLNKNTWIA
jgi:hypothetical protein